MNKESVYLLKVLKGFIHQKDPGSFQGDWGKLMQLAGIHFLLGTLGYMVISYPNEDNKKVEALMRKQCMQTIAAFSVRAGYLQQLSARMQERGIDHLLFKGVVLKDYYPIPELRTYGDIDLLIRPQDRKACDALMMELGFQRKNDWEPVYSYFNKTEYYEIHTDVMEIDVSDKADYKGYFQNIWEHARPVAEHVYELTPEFHFLYLLTHIAKHISGAGAGIRMYLDIAAFLQHFGSEIDWEFIKNELKYLQLEEFANVVLTVVRKYFGVESPIALRPMDRQLLEEFMEYTLAGGVFGHVGREPGLISLKQQATEKSGISRIGTFFRRLFAPANELEKRYTYLKGRHFLLPVAWVHRLVKTRGNWSEHAWEAHGIIKADAGEVQKLKRLYKEIGL